MKIMKGMPKIFVTLFLLTFFAGTNHCLLENLLGSLSEPVQNCDVDGSQHQHGAPCSSLANAPAKSVTFEQQLDKAPLAIFHSPVSLDIRYTLNPSSKTGALGKETTYPARPLFTDLTLAANAPPIIA